MIISKLEVSLNDFWNFCNSTTRCWRNRKDSKEITSSLNINFIACKHIGCSLIMLNLTQHNANFSIPQKKTRLPRHRQPQTKRATSKTSARRRKFSHKNFYCLFFIANRSFKEKNFSFIFGLGEVEAEAAIGISQSQRFSILAIFFHLEEKASNCCQ